MARTQRIVALLATVAFAIGALGSPAVAAKTKLTIVNGTPGKKLDVCVNGREVRSGLKYGAFFKKTVKKPKAMVKFYPRRKGACRGTLLGKKLVKPARAVVVRTKHDPGRVLMFKEPSFPAPSAVVAYDVIVNGLNASELPKLWFGVKMVVPGDARPAMGQSIDKGEQGRAFAAQFGDTEREVERTVFQNPEQVVKGPVDTTIRGFRYIQWLLVGTSAEDLKVVSFARRIGLVEEQP